MSFTFQCSTAGPMPRMARPAGPTSSPSAKGLGQPLPDFGVVNRISHVEGCSLRGGDPVNYTGDHQMDDAEFHSASKPGSSPSNTYSSDPTLVPHHARPFHRDEFLPIDPDNLRDSLKTFRIQLDLNQVWADTERLRAALVTFPEATMQTFLSRYGNTGLSFAKFEEFINLNSPQLFACHKSSAWTRTPGVAELEALAEQSVNCPHEELVKHFMWLHCPRWAQREAKEELDLPLINFKRKLMVLLANEGSPKAPVYSSLPNSQNEPANRAVAATKLFRSGSPINRADIPEASQRAAKVRRRRRRRRGSKDYAPSQPRLLTPPTLSGQQRRASPPACPPPPRQPPARQPPPTCPSSARPSSARQLPPDVVHNHHHHQQKRAKQQSPPLSMKEDKKKELQPSDAAHARRHNHHQHHQRKMAKQQSPPLSMKEDKKQELQPSDAARAEHCHHRHNHHQQQHGRAIPKQQDLMADQLCRAAATTTPFTTRHITSAKEFVSNFYSALNTPLQFNSFFPFISQGQILPRSTSFCEPSSLFKTPMALSPVLW